MVLCTACTNSCLGTHFGYEQTPKSAWFIACEAVISGKGVLKPELVQRHPENSVILRGCELIELDDISPYFSSSIQPRNKDLHQVACEETN